MCRLYVASDAIRVGGLEQRWPKRVTRALAPLDFKQQSDQKLADLFGMFTAVPLPQQFTGKQFVYGRLTRGQART